MSSSAGRRILKASLAVMAAHIIFKLISAVQSILVIPRVCPPEVQDLFAFAFDTVLMTFYLVGEEGLGPAFLPVFMEELDKKGEKEAWNFANALITAQIIIIGLVVAAVMSWPQEIVNLFTDWNTTRDAEFLNKANHFVRWIIPALFCLSAGSTTYLILNGYKKFFLAALGDASVKFMIIIMAVSGFLTGGDFAFWLCGGVILGSVAKVATHMLGLGGKSLNFRPSLKLNSPAFKAFALLILPLLVGIIFAKVRDIYNDAWILSHLPDNLLRINKAGKRLFQAVGWLVPYGVSIAMYPFFCELVDRDNKEELSQLVSRSSRIIFVLMAPVSALMVALAGPFTQLIYNNPNFDLTACSQAAVSTSCYTLVLPFFALEYIFMQAFFSNRRMASPIFIGIVFSMLSMGISYLGVVKYPQLFASTLSGIGLIPEGSLAHAAVAVVALSFMTSRMLKVLTLGGMMKRFLPGGKTLSTVWFGLRMLVAAGASGIFTWFVRITYERYINISGQGFSQLAPKILPQLALASISGIIVYVVALRLICPEEWRQTRDWTIARFNKFRNRKDAS